jgi:hypothetical protein
MTRLDSAASIIVAYQGNSIVPLLNSVMLHCANAPGDSWFRFTDGLRSPTRTVLARLLKSLRVQRSAIGLAAPEDRARDIAQAKALRGQVSKGGLRCEVFLPSGLAEWILDFVRHQGSA